MKGRYYLVVSLFLLAVGGLSWRLVKLSVIDRDFLLSQGDARSQRILTMPAHRGMITDRNGEPLAVSTPVQSIWAVPEDFKLNSMQLADLAKRLGVTTEYLTRTVAKAKSREFVYLKRGLAPSEAKKIADLHFPGVYSRQEFRRFYPTGEVSAHILGFTDIDDQGQEGLELSFNQWLRGESGKKRVLRDRLGRVVAELQTVRPSKPGHELRLTIDKHIQYIAYRELKAAVEKFDAKSGSIVVLDPQTGEILAMVNQPSYNPNQRTRRHHSSFRNRAVTDLFEPGSVIKPFSVASALATGRYSPQSLIDTNPGVLTIDGNRITDDRRNLGIISVTDVIKRSSNIGVTKMVLTQTPEYLWRFLHKTGFGQSTQSGFPGEREGSLVNHRIWRDFALATLAWGYGLSVTPLQLAHGYSIFANKGSLPKTSIILSNAKHSSRQVLQPKIAKQMLTMLEAVVEQQGTGRFAEVKQYRIAGKTGTARIAGKGGYEKNRHIASFVGIAPASNPRLVVAVVINEPRKISYYGSRVAAPVFAKVIQGALQALNVAPDKFIAEAA